MKNISVAAHFTTIDNTTVAECDFGRRKYDTKCKCQTSVFTNLIFSPSGIYFRCLHEVSSGAVEDQPGYTALNCFMGPPRICKTRR